MSYHETGPQGRDSQTPPGSPPRDAPGPQDGIEDWWAGYRAVGDDESVSGNRHWWDAEAAGYRDEHGGHLSGRLVWGPEGLDEADAGLLGPVEGRAVLELGAGSGDCSAWLRGQGAAAVATDLSLGMLRQPTGPGQDGDGVPRIQCDARRLPFAAKAFDVVFSSYGAVPFVGDPEVLFAEVVRVLRPGGRWVFSITHPIRWAFPDDPGAGGLTADRSYFDRTPYAELDAGGTVLYAEHHRTLGERIRSLTAAGFRLLDLVEPEWPDGFEQLWGGWSPLRGRLIPGTAIFVCTRDQPQR